MAFTTLDPLLSHKVFRWASGISALVALTLLGLGVAIALGGQTLRSSHSWTALVFLVTSLLASLSALSYSRQSRTKGLVGHAFGVFGLSIGQYALGELGQTIIHIILGVLLTLGAVALFVLSLRQPKVVTGSAVRASGPAEPPAGPAAE